MSLVAEGASDIAQMGLMGIRIDVFCQFCLILVASMTIHADRLRSPFFRLVGSVTGAAVNPLMGMKMVKEA